MKQLSVMAKIIYKKGMERQNKLSCIDGIEIELFNGQKALIYPHYAEKPLLTSKQRKQWNATNETEIEAMQKTSTALETECFLEIGSPAAEWVSQFKWGRYINFYLPSLLAEMEIQQQKADIDVLAETIEGADLLKHYTSAVLSCSRHLSDFCWAFAGNLGFAYPNLLSSSILVVPTILYRYIIKVK